MLRKACVIEKYRERDGNIHTYICITEYRIFDVPPYGYGEIETDFN